MTHPQVHHFSGSKPSFLQRNAPPTPHQGYPFPYLSPTSWIRIGARHIAIHPNGDMHGMTPTSQMALGPKDFVCTLVVSIWQKNSASQKTTSSLSSGISTSRKDMLVWNVWSKCFPTPLHFHPFPQEPVFVPLSWQSKRLATHVSCVMHPHGLHVENLNSHPSLSTHSSQFVLTFSHCPKSLGVKPTTTKFLSALTDTPVGSLLFQQKR